MDGLRTLAVVPVILFHVGFDVFGGGFVGVDIFFVISGYLITSIIYREVEEQRFSIVQFYERRIRRIFPALFTVFLVSLIIGWFMLLPSSYEGLGASTFWATLLLSNVLFWSESGYFDADAESKPLLHTWSLSVEEQFYVVFPFALMLMYRVAGRKGVAWFVAVSICASFCWAVLSVKNSPNAAFFLDPSRAWELGVGSLLALGVLPEIKVRRVAESAAVFGLLLIAASIFLYDGATPFPGLAALLPCMGVALVIHATSHCRTQTAKILAHRALVFVGLVSYSLYLWHWPVIVFFRSYFQTAPNLLEKSLLVGASVCLAMVSWKYIERPFRQRAAVFGRTGLFAAAVVSMSVFAGAGVAIGLTDGAPHRLPADVLLLGAGANNGTQRQECYGIGPDTVANGGLCRVADETAAVTFIVWGDSHAYALMPGIEAFAAKYGYAGHYAPKGS